MSFTPHPYDRQRGTLVLESEPLGEGGQGRVIRVPGPENLVYKEYMPQAGAVNGAALAELVDFGRRQPAGSAGSLSAQGSLTAQGSLLGQCAWPLARVVEGNRVTGFLMRCVPEEFYAPIGGKSKLVELQYLLYQPNWAWEDLHQPDIQGRLEIAQKTAKLIGLLHDTGWIIGDLSFRNLLWRPGRPYQVFMLDCDGLRRTGAEPVLRQAHTPDWDDPHQPSTGPDLDTDRYKLALLVGRVLSRTASVRPGQDLMLLSGLPDQVITAVKELFNRAQGSRGTRPSAAEWAQALDGRKRIAVTRPPRPQPSGSTLPSGPAAPISLPPEERDSVPVSRPATRNSAVSAQPPSQPPERKWTSIAPSGGRTGSVVTPPRPDPVPTLGQRVIASDAFAEQRRLAPRGVAIADDTVARLIDDLATGNGRLPVVKLAKRLSEPVDRVPLLIGALKGLLNVEGSEVIALKDGDQTVYMNVTLLKEQFLEEVEP
ncbi:hypothetical protein [Sphaerimonospora thailandensis]|uniref:Alkaline phosphatase-like protein PglZ C-terminal domain-containing protein n=1 Tax=Sphaerimonospora thailandensis TaxID=795644 RepID=A0A8J3VXC6_9ACTN|nr:hypothetical protein [Sphaerimonospora thailandensis]GIH67760.1 hypothetical protein Mth01_00130 [Sphaerimonospora thailandensis]